MTDNNYTLSKHIKLKRSIAMAMLRNEFKVLFPEQLRKLVTENINFINAVAPFSETKKINADIKRKIHGVSDKVILQKTLVDLMKVVVYWDNHQGDNGLFKPVEKGIVADMLRSASENLGQPMRLQKK